MPLGVVGDKSGCCGKDNFIKEKPLSEGKNEEHMTRSMSPGRGDKLERKVTESFFQKGPHKVTTKHKNKQLFLAGEKRNNLT